MTRAKYVACVAAVSFPFQAERSNKRASKRAREGAHWSEQKIGEKWGEDGREGGGCGEKRNHLQSIPNI